MLDMDASLKLPEGILAEQTLQNSGLSADYQLLVRAAIQGEMTMERLCEELVAQRSRIHERESRSGKGHYNKSYKGYHGKGYGGKDRRPWSRAYHAQGPEEYYECEEWDANSQSLGGYEEYDNEDTAYVMDEDDLICSAYNSMLEDGFDETDYEAAEYAAEVLQAEAEAYFLRSKAGQSGPSWLWWWSCTAISGARSFDHGRTKGTRAAVEVQDPMSSLWPDRSLGK